MSPIVRMAYFVGVSFLAIIVLLCAAWWDSTYLSTSGLWTARGSGICAGEYLTPLDYLRYETSS